MRTHIENFSCSFIQGQLDLAKKDASTSPNRHGLVTSIFDAKNFGHKTGAPLRGSVERSRVAELFGGSGKSADLLTVGWVFSIPEDSSIPGEEISIPIEVLDTNDYGILSAKVRWEAAIGSIVNPDADCVFDVETLLIDFASDTGLDKTAKGIARPLISSILQAIRDEEPPRFRWDKDRDTKLAQIQIVFAICDYWCLEPLQRDHLEPFYEKFPDVALRDAPPTARAVQATASELEQGSTKNEGIPCTETSKEAGLHTHVLDRFSRLECLKLNGRVPQACLDALPASLPRLVLPSFDDMRGARLERKEIALAAMAHQHNALWHVSDELKRDRGFMSAAIDLDGWSLAYASAEIQADEKMVLAAVASCGWALKHASSALQANKDVVLAAMARDGGALEFACKELQGDKDVVLAAVAQRGLALKYASEELQSNIEVVSAAVAQTGGSALEHAHDILRRSSYFIRSILPFDIKALEWAVKEVVLNVVAEDGLLLQFSSREARKDRGVVLVAVAQNGLALEFASSALRRDREVVLVAVTQDGRALEHASEALQADQHVVIAAAAQDSRALEFAHKTLQENEDVLNAASSARKDP